MSDLKKELIRLGSTNPDLRKHIAPVIDKMAAPSLQGKSLYGLINSYIEEVTEQVAIDLQKSGIPLHYDKGAVHFYLFTEGDEEGDHVTVDFVFMPGNKHLFQLHIREGSNVKGKVNLNGHQDMKRVIKNISNLLKEYLKDGG